MARRRSRPSATLCALALLLSLTARADPPVRYEGVDRTDPGFLDSALDRCRRDGPLVERDAVRGCLYDTRLFSTVDVRDGGDGFVVTLDERWTLVPLPVVRIDRGEAQAGLFLVETNLFGAGKLLVLGGAYGSRGGLAMAIYRDRSILYSDWTATMTYALADAAVRHEDGARLIDAFDETAHRVELALGHRFGRTTEVSTLYSARWQRFGPADGFAAPADLDDVRVGLGLRYQRTRFELYFDEGISVQAAGRVQVARRDARVTDAPRVWSGEVAASWQVGAFGDQALQIRPSGLWSNTGDPRTAERVGGKPGLRGAPAGSVWARRVAALAIDYQIPVWRPSIGTVTVAPFVDVAGVQRVTHARPRWGLHAAGGLGAYLFLSDIAFPGVGVVAGFERSAGAFAVAAVGAGF